MGGGREARKAEAAVKKKLIADAQVALGKIEAAHSAEALAAAIKAAQPFSSAASLQQALPAAKQRLASLTAQADKAVKSDFLSRVEEAERRDMRHPHAKSKAEEHLKRYFEEVFREQDADHSKEWDFGEFKKAMDIIAPSIRGKDLKAAFALADEDGSGSIDAEEFMRRAGQYRSLSEKIGEGHTCRRGSLTSVSVPTAAALKPEQRPAAAPLLQAQHSGDSSTATPGSTPPRGSDSAAVQRSAATGGSVPRAVAISPPTVRRESIVAGFTDADKEQAARLFSEHDDDGSGELDFDEFREVMREIAGKALSDKQLQEAFSAVDTDGNGMVSWDEFLEGQQELRKWKQKRKPKSRRKTAEA